MLSARTIGKNLRHVRALPVLAGISLAAALAADAHAMEEESAAHEHVVIHEDATLSLAALVQATAAFEGGAPVVEAMQASAAGMQRAARHPLPAAPAIAAGVAADGFGDRGQGYRQGRVALELPLWWPQQRAGRRLIAAAAAQEAAGAARVHALEVAGWLRAALAEIALAEARLELAQRDWDSTRALVHSVERAVELGERARSELLLVEAESLDTKMAVLEAIEEHKHTADSYHLLTGLNRRPQDWSEEEAAGARFGEHPLLAQATAAAARARAEIDRLNLERWGQPLLSLGSEHERDGREAPFSDRFALGIRIPLGWGADAIAELAAAQLAAAETERDRVRLERALRQQLAEAEHSLALSKQRVRLATDQAAITAERSRLIERAFELGEVDVNALLLARSRARTGERRLREAIIRERFHVAERNQALGVVP